MNHFHASRVYMLMSFITSLANATMFTTYAIYQVIELGLTPLQLLMVGMVLEVTVLLFEGITGALADTYGRRRSVVTGMFILGFGFVLEGSALWLGQASPLNTAFMWLLLSQVFFGIGATFVSGADSAWMVDEVGEDSAGRIFMRARRAGLVGSLIGIVLSVSISTFWGSNLPYIAGGILYLALHDIPPMTVKEGEQVHITLVNEGGGDHPFHIHGHTFQVLSRDGMPLKGSPVYLDTLLLKEGESYEVQLMADNPGLWMAHCHNLGHASMGMTMMMNYEGITTPFRVGTRSGNLPDL